MVRAGLKSKGYVIDRVRQPLKRPIEIGGCGIDEEEVIKIFGYQSPASDQWIAQNQGGVVPDKTVAHSRRIADEDNDKKNEDGPDFFHETRKSISRASRFANVYVDLARSFFWSGNDCRQERAC